MTINKSDHIADNARRQSLIAAGGRLGAVAASSCCILPLGLFGLGISAAWFGNFTSLAAYQPSIVKGSLEAVPGVAKVAVSFKEKTATIVYDDAKADVNQLTSATTKAGYPSAPKS